MTRRSLAVVAVALAVVVGAPATALLATAGAPARDNAADPPSPPAGDVDWRLDQVGRDPRSLELFAYGSSCLRGRLRPAVDETARAIRITVGSERPEICTDDYGAQRLTVALRAPIRGRPVLGPHELTRDPVRPPGVAGSRVPRVLGLAPDDAIAVVRARGLRPQLERVADLRTRARVVGQTPGSGHLRRAGAPVTLFVSR